MSVMLKDEKPEFKNNFSDTEKLIEIVDLKISFGWQNVLKNVSLHLNKGENLVIFGKSGSGKSVLIKCIVKLLKPDSGTIRVFGKTIHDNDQREQTELRKKIGFLFQSGALYDSMTVKENLEFPLRRYQKNISQKELDERVKEAIKNVGLSDMLHKMPSELSGGMRKRIALARTIIIDPLIMLYDEPTTGLDPITSGEISELINKVKRQYNTSSIIITHDIACARETADRVIFLKDGKVKAEGTLQQLERSDDPWIKLFLK
jgi:phospholipid/cholesterol/gamma-HCH transport system ATP-binding protein